MLKSHCIRMIGTWSGKLVKLPGSVMVSLLWFAYNLKAIYGLLVWKTIYGFQIVRKLAVA